MATIKQETAIKKVVENGGNVSKAMRDAKYSIQTAKNPKKLTDSKAWEEIMQQQLPDKAIARVHKELMGATRMEHMTFPPFNEEKKNNKGKGEQLTDDDIVLFLAEVNCRVRRIVHGELVRHVYFWSADNVARDKALDKAYKLKGHYQAEERKHTGKITLASLFEEDD